LINKIDFLTAKEYHHHKNIITMALPNFSNDTIKESSFQTDTTVLGAGDVFLHKNFVDADESKKIFDNLMENIDFQQWYHMPNKGKDPLPLKRIKRIVVTPDSDGNIPYYRFTVNNQSNHSMITPMPPVIESLCQKINQFLNVELNHVVILLYRDGSDCIGFHKDKTLDLDEDSPIVSLSLGCTRTYCLRDDIFNPKINQEIELEDGTLLVLGPKTNNSFYHSIKPCNKQETESVTSRISITFRKAVTFKQADGTLIGKGSQYQTLDWPEELNGKHVIGF
jgi:alkylated DNA repair dioxygenase AlkB